MSITWRASYKVAETARVFGSRRTGLCGSCAGCYVPAAWPTGGNSWCIASSRRITIAGDYRTISWNSTRRQGSRCSAMEGGRSDLADPTKERLRYFTAGCIALWDEIDETISECSPSTDLVFDRLLRLSGFVSTLLTSRGITPRRNRRRKARHSEPCASSTDQGMRGSGPAYTRG